MISPLPLISICLWLRSFVRHHTSQTLSCSLSLLDPMKWLMLKLLNLPTPPLSALSLLLYLSQCWPWFSFPANPQTPTLWCETYLAPPTAPCPLFWLPCHVHQHMFYLALCLLHLDPYLAMFWVFFFVWMYFWLKVTGRWPFFLPLTQPILRFWRGLLAWSFFLIISIILLLLKIILYHLLYVVPLSQLVQLLCGSAFPCGLHLPQLVQFLRGMALATALMNTGHIILLGVKRVSRVKCSLSCIP